jgi:secreted trypsin-like serine protease
MRIFFTISQLKKNYVKASIQGMIIGGTNAVQKQFPWHCTTIIDDSMLCGSSLITPSSVLFAAHCAEGWVRRFNCRVALFRWVMNLVYIYAV